MAVPAIIRHTGSLSGVPSTATTIYPSLQEIGNTSFERTYSQRMSGAPSVIGATDLLPFLLPLGTLTKVRMLWLRCTQSIKLKITSPVGIDQVLNVSDEILLHNPNEGDQLTAIKLVGTADIEYAVAGD